MKRSGEVRHGSLLAMVVPLALWVGSAAAQPSVVPPATFDVAGRTPLAVLHGVGAQIYACAADANGRTTWTFREPIATLIDNGKTVGRHYLGPTWALADGEVITGKTSASAPGDTPQDVPLLKLDVTERHGEGVLSVTTLVLRLNTHGGALKGDCDRAGDLRAETYAADYVFLR
jgi:hypothetical protein